MSIFEGEFVDTTRFAHPDIEEFDVWLDEVDKTALDLAVQETARSHSSSHVSSASTEVPDGLLALTPDLMALAESLAASKHDTARGFATEVEITSVSNWIPLQQREQPRPRLKREPHYKAWRPKSTHTPVLVEVSTVAQPPKSDACADEDPRIFESQTVASVTLAKSICARCTSVENCLGNALRAREFMLTQAGMSAEELKNYSKHIS